MRTLFTLLITALALPVQPLAADCPSIVWTGRQTLSGYVDFVENVRAVDYDHDGKPDLVGTIRPNSGGTSTLYAWHGVGDGTFEPPVSLVTSGLGEIEILNVNNDAYLDLVGATYGSGIWVRLGNATGFDNPITTLTGFGILDISEANLNGDSYGDLVIAGGTVVALWAGSANGTFTEIRRQTVSQQSEAYDAIAGDFDNDGYLDVAYSKVLTDAVGISFRNADGTFGTAISIAAGDEAREVKAGDFNEDGLLDLISTSWFGGNVDVYINQGNRSFAPRFSLPVAPPGSEGGSFQDLILDINGDGNLDIIGAGVNNSWFATHLGLGNGTFAAGTWFAAEESIFALAAANFDISDTDLELALGRFGELLSVDFTCGTQVNGYSYTPTISTGSAAPLRALVSGVSPLTPQPRGTVTFKEGATILGTADVDATGLAKLDHSGFSTGTHTITAEFSGNTALDAAVSAGFTQKVTNTTTTTTISLGTSTYGEPFNSTVAITSQSSGPVLGWYYLTLDGVTETKRRWSGAPLTLTLNAGPHTISAQFWSDSFNPASTSPTYNFTTAKHAVNVARNGELTVRQGTAHAIQFSVSATTTPVPSGSIQILQNGTPVGTLPLSNGQATYNATLARGSYDYSAVYSGDANYLGSTSTFELNVVANAQLAIDAHGLDSTISIPAVVPPGTTATTMWRSVHGANSWWAVSSWTLQSQIDNGAGLTRGVLYDYRLEATVSGSAQMSNVDSALLFTDPTVTAGSTTVKTVHFAELRDSINALRAMAGLTPVQFDGTFGTQSAVLASHVASLRTAVTEARSALSMTTATFTDPSPNGATIKAAHITELRNAAR